MEGGGGTCRGRGTRFRGYVFVRDGVVRGSIAVLVKIALAQQGAIGSTCQFAVLLFAVCVLTVVPVTPQKKCVCSFPNE